MDKKKIILIVIAIVVMAAILGYAYWKNKNKPVSTPTPVAQQAAEDIQKAVAGISADVGKSVSPDVTTPIVNPVQTDANPYNKTNPFSNLKTNPFQ